MQKPQHSHCLQSIISTTALFKFSVHNAVGCVCLDFRSSVAAQTVFLAMNPILGSWKKHSFIWLCFFSYAHFRYTNGVLFFFGICFYLVIVPLTFRSVFSLFFCSCLNCILWIYHDAKFYGRHLWFYCMVLECSYNHNNYARWVQSKRNFFFYLQQLPCVSIKLIVLSHALSVATRPKRNCSKRSSWIM